MENRDMGEKPLSSFNEILALVFVFHSTFDVGRSMFDVHLLICSTFIISRKPSTVLPLQKIT
jgi:hypothetical protein